jgi:5-formyltetrahydrofolate cyclo-ligase
LARDSALLQTALCKTASFQRADIVCVYAASPAEVSMKSAIDRAFAQAKRVFLPRCDAARPGVMRMLQIYPHDNVDAFKRNRWNIAEPSLLLADDRVRPCLDETLAMNLSSSPSSSSPPPRVCVVLPGMAFERAGRRLGYGAGYYDRWLQRLFATKPAAVVVDTVGVAFEFQLLPAVPTDAHDVHADTLVAIVGGEAVEISCGSGTPAV